MAATSTLDVAAVLRQLNNMVIQSSDVLSQDLRVFFVTSRENIATERMRFDDLLAALSVVDTSISPQSKSDFLYLLAFYLLAYGKTFGQKLVTGLGIVNDDNDAREIAVRSAVRCLAQIFLRSLPLPSVVFTQAFALPTNAWVSMLKLSGNGHKPRLDLALANDWVKVAFLFWTIDGQGVADREVIKKMAAAICEAYLSSDSSQSQYGTEAMQAVLDCLIKIPMIKSIDCVVGVLGDFKRVLASKPNQDLSGLLASLNREILEANILDLRANSPARQLFIDYFVCIQRGEGIESDAVKALGLICKLIVDSISSRCHNNDVVYGYILAVACHYCTLDSRLGDGIANQYSEKLRAMGVYSVISGFSDNIFVTGGRFLKDLSYLFRRFVRAFPQSAVEQVFNHLATLNLYFLDFEIPQPDTSGALRSLAQLIDDVKRNDKLSEEVTAAFAVKLYNATYKNIEELLKALAELKAAIKLTKNQYFLDFYCQDQSQIPAERNKLINLHQQYILHALLVRPDFVSLSAPTVQDLTIKYTQKIQQLLTSSVARQIPDDVITHLCRRGNSDLQTFIRESETLSSRLKLVVVTGGNGDAAAIAAQRRQWVSGTGGAGHVVVEPATGFGAGPCI